MRPSHPPVIQTGKGSGGISDEKANVLTLQVKGQFSRNLQDVVSEIQYDQIRRPSDPDYHPPPNNIALQMSESGSSSADYYQQNYVGGTKGALNVVNRHQSQNFGNMQQMNLKMNKKRKEIKEINAAS